MGGGGRAHKIRLTFTVTAVTCQVHQLPVRQNLLLPFEPKFRGILALIDYMEGSTRKGYLFQNKTFFSTPRVTWEGQYQHKYSRHCCPYYFVMAQVWRICLNIKTFVAFVFNYSHTLLVCVIQKRYL